MELSKPLRPPLSVWEGRLLIVLVLKGLGCNPALRAIGFKASEIRQAVEFFWEHAAEFSPRQIDFLVGDCILAGYNSERLTVDPSSYALEVALNHLLSDLGEMEVRRPPVVLHAIGVRRRRSAESDRGIQVLAFSASVQETCVFPELEQHLPEPDIR